MVGLRKAKCYHWDSPAYTRVSKITTQSYITGIPGSKMVDYTMGNTKAKLSDFDTQVSIVSCGKIMIRDNAYDAARTMANKVLETDIGMANYVFKVRPYAFHVIRENVMATGAGADRVQTGMRQSFGRPIGRAARIRNNQKIMSVYLNTKNMEEGKKRVALVKKAFDLAVKKLPGKSRILVEDNQK